MANSTMAVSPISAERVDYQGLKSWIAAQEAFEAATKQPAPLTSAQRQAVADLTRLIQPKTMPLAQTVDLGDKDYISILQLWSASKLGTGVTVTYNEPAAVPAPPPAPSPSWTQTLTLRLPGDGNGSPLVFPSHSTGGLIRNAAPYFPSKKNAKKYAAKICFDWLVSQGRFGSSSSSSSSSVSTSVSVSASPAPPPIPDGGGAPLAPPTATLKRKGGASGEEDDDSVPVTQRVVELCRKLGIQAPKYALTETGAAWSAEPDFELDAFRFAAGFGRVEGARSKAHAKEMVAEEVLAWLVGEEERREGVKRRVWGENY
ncbi:hypothetical protein GE09DRAFT_1118745 [Coniochaeta sp. 2T2.1]|nr:hypothetical protein GE09DRAFT_1118745 [Coniochaeta sp. 2T2.1]